ncbi:MAG: hypothetical protein CR988_03980 [Treponema sp.]|nr:MAG: hypothetical protein CR988_03980 [Treponema sp.]
MNKKINIHSKYNPQKESERFVETVDGSPLFIIISEPGESYLEKPLRKKFPKAKLIAVRYTDSMFLESDTLWDYVWRPADGNLLFFLINTIPDEHLGNTKFLAWEPSNRIWQEQAKYVWNIINKTVKTIQSIIYTRRVFGPKWFKNILKNTIYSENIVNLNIPKSDFLLAAAGPSLNSFFEIANAKIPILAVSSALQTLKFNNIIPDICISTDGGFWACNHFRNINQNIPLLFPLEASVPSFVLKKNPLAVLNYNSILETVILNELKIPSISGKRNGTVAGTAVELLLENTEHNIFMTGLDLCATNGFSHSRPHESSIKIENASKLLHPLATELYKVNIDSRSLETYSAWFRGLKKEKTKRLFRLGYLGYELPNIERIRFEQFAEKATPSTQTLKTISVKTASYKEKKNTVINILQNAEKNIVSQDLNELLSQNSVEKEIIEMLCYKEFIEFLNNKNSNKSEILKSKIKTKLKTIIKGYLA